MPRGKRKELLNFTLFVNQSLFSLFFSEASICVPFVFCGLEFGFKEGNVSLPVKKIPRAHFG